MVADDRPMAALRNATGGIDEEVRLMLAALALVALGLCVAWLG